MSNPPVLVGLTGVAGTGKDTIAAQLVARYGYVRVAFADALRDAALDARPIIRDPRTGKTRHLAPLVNAHGWEDVKRNYPDARRFLENLGVAMRDVVGPDVWVDAAFRKVTGAIASGYPVVITDASFPNEFDTIRARGGVMFRVHRAAAPPLTDNSHISQVNRATLPVDYDLDNNGPLRDVQWIAQRVNSVALGCAVGRRLGLGATA